MTTLRIALLQLAFNGEPQAKGERYCREAKAAGADIALFPEMWNIGYRFPDVGSDHSRWAEQAVSAGGEFVRNFADLARELGMAIGITYLERGDPALRNVVSLIDRKGETLFTYAKVHTCDFDVESAITPGDRFEVAPLDTDGGPVEVGAMICFDREFPESARVLMLQGAEVILVPNACPMDEMRWATLRVRAFENMVCVALANYAQPDDNGGSAAYHPMAWDGPDGPPMDTTIVCAGAEEAIIYADIDLDALRAWRATETQGDAYRKPAAYGRLLSNEVHAPFRRPDSRR